jgi:transposase-like protein
MESVLRETLENLFVLLDYKNATTKNVFEEIEKEINAEMKKGLLKESKCPKSIHELEKMLTEEEVLQVLETSASRVLVDFFAEHKKRFDERQKEVYLTFLLTNKLQRELEKYISAR